MNAYWQHLVASATDAQILDASAPSGLRAEVQRLHRNGLKARDIAELLSAWCIGILAAFESPARR
jgi:site-specific recombinase XerC